VLALPRPAHGRGRDIISVFRDREDLHLLILRGYYLSVSCACTSQTRLCVLTSRRSTFKTLWTSQAEIPSSTQQARRSELNTREARPEYNATAWRRNAQRPGSVEHHSRRGTGAWRLARMAGLFCFGDRGFGLGGV